jgi:hypothetical protein
MVATALMPEAPDRWEDLRANAARQPFFCEENVFCLLTSGALPEAGAAVFVTNRARQVAMWGQRLAAADPILWDYHVVALLPQAGLILDLDDRERFAWPVADWLLHAFRAPSPRHQPRFRIVPQAELLATFSSDRRHMRGRNGEPLQPFPPWPAPFRPGLGHTLHRFLDLDDPIAGTVTDVVGFPAAAAAAGRRR